MQAEERPIASLHPRSDPSHRKSSICTGANGAGILAARDGSGHAAAAARWARDVSSLVT